MAHAFAVACHYDIVDWLEPDWLLDMASGELVRGRLWRRPIVNIRIFKTSPRHWRVFAKHHYLNSKDIPGATCYVAEIENQPACFVAVRSSIGFKGVRRISRIVTMPDFQGVGVGMACLNAVAELTLAQPGVDKITIVTGHPGMMHGLDRSGKWHCTRFMKCGGPHNSGRRDIASSAGRACAGFRFVPASERNQALETTASVPSTESGPSVSDQTEASTRDRKQTGRSPRRRAARNR